MSAARYWRLVGVEAYAGDDLELSELHLYDATGRVDDSATLTCSFAPTAGTLANLGDADTATNCRFAGEAVRSAGFWLKWDFGAGVTKDISAIRFAAGTARALFFANGCLQQSTDGTTWVLPKEFGRVLYPGASTYTSNGDLSGGESVSEWDAASKGSSSTISGRTASVWGNFSGYVRTNTSRQNGRRVFGLRLTSANPPQTFFGGLAALTGWGPYNTGKHWAIDGSDGTFYYATPLAVITLSPGPGTLATVGDVMYYDVDLDAGDIALKKNSGAWTARVSLPNFTAGADYIIDTMSASTSSNVVGAALLTTADDLAGHIPSGASPWDKSQDSSEWLEPVPVKTRGAGVQVVASAPGVAHRVQRFRASVARDIAFGGPGTIYGTTKTKGTTNLPTKARVVLLHQRSKQPVRETWSDPATGAFEFRGIDTAQQFLTLAEDADGTQTPVAANYLMPE